MIDNTNPTIQERAKYIQEAKARKYKIIGYYFESKLENALRLNNLRIGKEHISEIGIKSTLKKLELPNWEERCIHRSFQK